MDYSIISQLLEKYFKGNTSLEEENTLGAYFKGEAIHPDLVEYKPLFAFFETEKETRLSDAFSSKLLAKIEPHQLQLRRVRLLPLLSKAAAVLILLVFGGYYLYQNGGFKTTKTETAAIDWSKYEPKNPEEALNITKTALKRVSKELNEGADQAARQVERIKQKHLHKR